MPGFFDDVEVSRRRDVGSAGATYFVFDPGGRLIGEYDDVGTSNVEYVYIENQPLAMLQGGAIYYYHTDQLGTPQILTDYVQEIGWKANYTPFGDTIFSANIVDNSLRFPGQYFDAETGLHYNYFRDYDPTIGRYITSDRLGLVAGVGTYSYVGANPQRFTDRLGLEGGLPDAFPGVGDFERATGKDILQAALLTLAPGTLFFNPSLAALGAVAGGGGAGATGGSLSDVAIGTVTGIVVGPVAPASGLVRLTLSSVASSLAGQTAVNLRRCRDPLKLENISLPVTLGAGAGALGGRLVGQAVGLAVRVSPDPLPGLFTVFGAITGEAIGGQGQANTISRCNCQ